MSLIKILSKTRLAKHYAQSLGCCMLIHSGFVASPETSATFSFSDSHKHHIEECLQMIACAEEGEWKETVKRVSLQKSEIFSGRSLRESLNAIKPQILHSDDLGLIRLFNRAVRNHDALSSEKAEPVICYYKHYEPPPFYIPDIHMTIDVSENTVKVKSQLTVKRNSKENSLILDGRGHTVFSVEMNGQKLPKQQYRVTPNELVLFDIPEDDVFTLSVESAINPFDNASLEGMYQCGEWLTTQCESEGARRIFFTLDRPDVLSSMTTTIIADKGRYPFRLSNGDLMSESLCEDGRTMIVWKDPFPKPSYLFACVLGDFAMLTDHFTTRSGKEVELQVYVEKGKEERAKYSLFALKKAMEFDEIFYDREYDLSCLKMVGMPNFNSGAMENKGLMIFNDVRLLVDSTSGTDSDFRDVAQVIAHEYFHNWSGNRVTIRNWFEIALKEAFTDMRAVLFSEWLFGAEFTRPKTVSTLRDFQFPEENSENGHPLIVSNYVDAHSIYDSTTYVKGREVFRALKNYIDAMIPDGFRKVQNLYFSRFDGQAVTFRELLSSANEILGDNGNISQFERWFYQQGTPIVKAEMKYDEEKKIARFIIRQSCKHPRTGKDQQPLLIPFSIELLGGDGAIVHPQFTLMLEEKETILEILSDQKPTPIFMHGYSAPVILKYDYALEDLASIVKHTNDAFSRWEAAQQYTISALNEVRRRLETDATLADRAANGEVVIEDLLHLYAFTLQSETLSPLAKAQILEIPSLRALAQAFNDYDFPALYRLRQFFISQIAMACKTSFKALLEEYPSPKNYKPEPAQMQVRELRNAIFRFLILVDENCLQELYDQYWEATNFNDYAAAYALYTRSGDESGNELRGDFYQRWKHDKAVFNVWLSAQAYKPDCTIDDLRKLENVQGFDGKNPNHLRSLIRAFIGNLACYHQPDGAGYNYVVDKILEIAKFNPLLAHNYITIPAFVDFEKLPEKQQTLMAKALKRLQCDEAPPQTRALVDMMLVDKMLKE